MSDALSVGSLVVCPTVYAEVAANFDSHEELARFASALSIQVDDFSDAALFLAGATWRRYAQRRGRRVQCPQCGHDTEVVCPRCGTLLSWRQRVLPDFLVGAHAATRADRLITRDVRFYQRHFPDLAVLAP